MVPLKLMTRSLGRVGASLHNPTFPAKSPLSLRISEGLRTLYPSHPLNYSTEAVSPPKIPVSEPPPPPQLPEQPASTPKSSSKTGEKVNAEDKAENTPSSLSSRPEASETSPEKIRPDRLYKAIELEVLAYEPAVLDSYQWFVITAATHLGINVGKCWSPLKSDKFRFPLLKSAFVHKKHQVHYEIRTYHRFLTFHKLTGSTADTFLEYVERNLPEGVGLKVTKVEVQPLPEYLQQSQSTS